MTDEALRSAYAAAQAARATSDRRSCPPAEDLLALVERRGDETARLATLDHAMACTAGCATELELLRALHAAESAHGATTRSTGAPSLTRWRPRWTVPAAAAAILVVGVAIGTMRRTDVRPADDADTLRGATSSLALVSPADGAASAGPPPLVWRTVPGARTYTVEIIAPSGATVVDLATADTAFTWRPTTGPVVGDYRWWVRATDADGVAHESSIRRIRIGAR